MSAHGFIAEIFSRPQTNVASNERFITERQLNKLRDLIGADEEGSAVRKELNRLVWLPSGRWKYELVTLPGRTARYKLVRLGNIVPSSAGSLFG